MPTLSSKRVYGVFCQYLQIYQTIRFPIPWFYKHFSKMCSEGRVGFLNSVTLLLWKLLSFISGNPFGKSFPLPWLLFLNHLLLILSLLSLTTFHFCYVFWETSFMLPSETLSSAKYLFLLRYQVFISRKIFWFSDLFLC